MKKIALFILATCLVGASLLAKVLQQPAVYDMKPQVMKAYGLRDAGATSAQTIRVVFGCSWTHKAFDARSYRIVSFNDPNYAYEKFVMPTVAKQISQVTEFEVPVGAGLPKGGDVTKLMRTEVELTLPFPMKEGKRYSVIAQGNDDLMVTSAHTAHTFTYSAATTFVANDSLAPQMVGLRGMRSVGNGIFLLEFGAGYSPNGGNILSSYSFKYNGRSVDAMAVGRRTRLDAYLPHGWPYKALLTHDVFVELPIKIKQGDKLTVTVSDNVTAGNRTATLEFDLTSKALLAYSDAIQVNQIGYVPEGVKIAYLGRWLGSFPEFKREVAQTASSGMSSRYEQGPANMGAAASSGAAKRVMNKSLKDSSLSFDNPPVFKVYDAKTHQVVYTGTAKQVGYADKPDYKINHAGSDVYELDFTNLKKAGVYYVAIDGVGRSFNFTVADNAYEYAFKVQSYGVFAQRCGQELAPPYSPWHRIACHTKGVAITDIAPNNTRDLGLLGNYAKQHSYDSLTKLPIRGGHHDAGDYNPRSHLDVAQVLLLAYELAPQKFYDGQLNIPENGNGIPDIVDEALWSIRIWNGLYDDRDGSVYDGTESDGDPNFFQSVELDPKGDFAWGKSSRAALNYAAVMARAARILKKCNITAQPEYPIPAEAAYQPRLSADAYLARARKSFEWGLANMNGTNGDKLGLKENCSSYLVYAAAELYRTTGEAKYHDIIKTKSPWATQEKTSLIQNNFGDLSWAAYSYAFLPDNMADPIIKKRAIASIQDEADSYIWASGQMAYKFIRHAWAPISWGTGAYESYCMPIAAMWALTKDAKYYNWLIRTCDNTLGANPMSISWIVGLGERTVHAPLHNSRYSPFGVPVVGQQVEGPYTKVGGYNVANTLYPLVNQHAVLHNFVDAHFAIAMDEGVVNNQVKTMAVFGLLLPDKK